MPDVLDVSIHKVLDKDTVNGYHSQEENKKRLRLEAGSVPRKCKITAHRRNDAWQIGQLFDHNV